MKRLILESLLLLLYFELVMRFCDFKTLYRRVHEQKTRHVSPSGQRTKEEICRAVDIACVFYFKRTLCLQRSSVTAVLLRQHGWHAELVIGTQVLPFKSHAWVEIQGRVVNDKPYMPEIYHVLERC